MNTHTPKFRMVREAYMQHFSGRCIIHPPRRAVALHEEPPRSLNPHWGEQPDTWFPLCASCHENIQFMPRRAAARILMESKQKFPKKLLTNSWEVV
jgi:hypothetical protein